jgi:hypothetical protein
MPGAAHYITLLIPQNQQPPFSDYTVQNDQTAKFSRVLGPCGENNDIHWAFKPQLPGP